MENNLQLFSFLIDEDTIDDVNLYAFILPNEVREIIENITRSDDKYKAIANKSIYKIATSIFNGIIYCNNSISDIIIDNNRWVYSLEQFDMELLKEKIADWLTEEMKNKCGEIIQINFTELWQYEVISLKEILKQKSNNMYNLIPQYYIYKLSKESFNFLTLNRQLKFHRVIGEANVAEMFTLPIDIDVNKQNEKEKYKDKFSYVISAKLKTPIDINQSVLNIKLSTRIWTTYPIIRKDNNIIKSSLLLREATTIYVYKENPYFIDEELAFNKLSIIRSGSSEFKYKNTCDKCFSDILQINMDSILYNPVIYINEYNEDKSIALIVKKNSTNKDIEYGCGLPERNEALKLVQEKLVNLQLRKPIKLLCKLGAKKNMKFTTSNAKEYNFEKYIPQNLNKKKELVDGNKEIPCKPYKINLLNNKVLIHIATKDEEMKNMVIGVVRILLRLNKKISDNCYENDENLNVEFNIINNDFALYIKDGETKKDREKMIKSIFEDNRDVIQGAIIDIPRYDQIDEQKEKDSKYVVRNALKECKVINQFVSFISTEGCENEKIKPTGIDIIFSAVKDLLSACGFVEGDLYNITGIKENDILLGIGKISAKDNSNRIAISKIDKGIIYYKVYPDTKWKEAREYILNINNKVLENTKIQKLDNAKRQNISQWILNNIDETLKEKRIVYCFADCNMRGIWKQLTNDNFIDFNNLEVCNKEFLRLIRFNTEDEVPDYFIYKESKNNINRETGIFKSIKSTYYLVGEKHDGNRIRNDLTKLKAIRKPIKRQTLCEVNIQGAKNEEEQDEIIKITQMLRKMNISYKSDSSRPLPIYCINRIGEYMISIMKVNENTKKCEIK